MFMDCGRRKFRLGKTKSIFLINTNGGQISTVKYDVVQLGGGS